MDFVINAILSNLQSFTNVIDADRIYAGHVLQYMIAIDESEKTMTERYRECPHFEIRKDTTICTSQKRKEEINLLTAYWCNQSNKCRWTEKQ